MGRTEKSFKLGQCCSWYAIGVWLFFSPALLWAEDRSEHINLYPQFSDMTTYVYDDYLSAYARVFTQDAVPYWWAVGLSTAALLAVDDSLIEEAQVLGRALGVASEDHTTTVLAYENTDILRLPTDMGSLLYFIGDGWTHVGLAAGFLLAGSWTEDEKTYAVGFQIIEGMVTTTIATQFFKHITGRESPSRATTPTGRWDIFPNQIDYHNSIPAYDAFPSGHVAVGTMTLTVLAKNYPEKKWIMPVGVTLLSLLSFQMLNNEAHWASDYPLAIAFGYTFGSIAFERGQQSLAGVDVAHRFKLVPLIGEQKLGMGFHYVF